MFSFCLDGYNFCSNKVATEANSFYETNNRNRNRNRNRNKVYNNRHKKETSKDKTPQINNNILQKEQESSFTLDPTNSKIIKIPKQKNDHKKEQLIAAKILTEKHSNSIISTNSPNNKETFIISRILDKELSSSSNNSPKTSKSTTPSITPKSLSDNSFQLKHPKKNILINSNSEKKSFNDSNTSTQERQNIHTVSKKKSHDKTINHSHHFNKPHQRVCRLWNRRTGETFYFAGKEIYLPTSQKRILINKLISSNKHIKEQTHYNTKFIE